MKVGVYSIRDSVTGFYQTPTFDLNDAAAERNFKFGVNSNDFYGYSAGDIDLFKIGEFDSLTGKIDGIDPIMILSGVNAKDK